MCRERTLAHAAFALACGLTLALEKHLGGRNPITTPGQYSFLESLRTNLLHVPFIVFIILYTLRYQSPAAWFLNLKPIVKGGEASYSMYLLHPWLMYLFPWRGEATAPRSAELVSETVVRCGIIFLFIIIVARGTYLAIEVPGKRIVRSAAKRFGSNGRFTAWAIAAFYLLPIAGVVASVQLFFRYG